MAYNSLLDTLFTSSRSLLGDSSISDLEYYRGTVGSTLTDLERILSSTIRSAEDTVQMVCHPVRVIRAAVDYKIATYRTARLNGNADALQGLVQDAIAFGLAAYSGSSEVYKQLENYKAKVSETGHSLLLEKPVKSCIADGISWRASDPKRSAKTAQKLFENYSGRPLLFIVLGNGGIMAGMDVYLRYCALADDNASSYYVVRFSRHKEHDKVPKVIPSEIKYLKERAKTSEVVIFDEDCGSGITLQEAQAFFSKKLAHQNTIGTITNHDIIAEKRQRDIADFWAEVAANQKASASPHSS